MSETCLNLVDVVGCVEHMGFLLNEYFIEIFKTCKGGKSLRLNFILVCFFVQRKSITGDWSVNSRAVVRVLFDDVTMGAFKLNVLPRFVHFS